MSSSQSPDTPREQPSPSEETLAQAREILEKSELVNIRPVELSARSLDLPGRGIDVQVRTHVEFSVDVGLMANRIRYEIGLTDADGERVAEVSFTFQVEYDVEPGYEPPADGADFIAGTTGVFGAYPYARELAQNLTTRLQHDPLVLGLLPRGAGRARTVTQVARRSWVPEAEDAGEAAQGR